MMPAVTVLLSPRALPIATTHCPTSTASESLSGSGRWCCHHGGQYEEVKPPEYVNQLGLHKCKQGWTEELRLTALQMEKLGVMADSIKFGYNLQQEMLEVLWVQH